MRVDSGHVLRSSEPHVCANRLRARVIRACNRDRLIVAEFALMKIHHLGWNFLERKR